MMHKLFGRLASARSFVFAIASLATLAVQAFDTPYLTFRSATSFTLSATKRWDGTLQKATSNPTDEASWSDWTGSSISAGLSDGQYYIYLRGKDNTRINNTTSSPFTLSGATADIYCEGDIETLRDYEGNPPDMVQYCYAYLFNGWTRLVSPPAMSATTLAADCYRNMFEGCTALKSIPTLSATTVPDRGYYYMFRGCTSLEINGTLPGVEWRLPEGVTGGSIWNYNMFAETGGSFTGNPVANTPYYVASALPFGQIYQIAGKGNLDLALSGFSVNVDLSPTVKNGTAPYTFTHVSGTMPPGLNVLGSTLSGVPTSAGDYSFSLSVTDDESHTLASAAYTMKVVQPTIVPTTFVGADGSPITTNCIALTTDMTVLDQAWYVASGTLNYGTGGIKVSGDVNLVLANSASMTVQGASKKAGVNVALGNSLTIYGQSEGTGTLNASGNSSDGFDFGGAGIGGNDKESAGSVTINGGTINATGSQYTAAGIGGGKNGNGGTVTINGGTVTATGGAWYGAGIGGGQGGNGGAVTINGGTVTATAGSSGSGTTASTGIGKGYGSGKSVGTLAVGPMMSVKAGSTPNPTEEIGRGGAITIGTQRYFVVEKAGLVQETNEFSAYANESKNWNLADTISGGTTPYSFSPVTGYEPPSGLSLVGTTLSGSVAAADTYTIKYTVTDSSATPLVLEAVYTLTVTTPDPITAATNLAATVGKAKAFNIAETISGGVPPYSLAFSGTEPTGFHYNDGVLSGTATEANTYNFTITATDHLGTEQVLYYTLVTAESSGFTDDDPEEPASGDSVDCRTADGVVRSRTCTPLTSSSTVWNTGWYYVAPNTTLSIPGVRINGKVSLVLGDGATLTTQGESRKAGIYVEPGNTLSIYGQSAMTGTLVALGGYGAAGIGGDNAYSTTTGELSDCGKVNIYGGVITATGNGDAAGIGGGDGYGNGGTISVYGGNVTATAGSSSAAGIGKGWGSTAVNGTLTVGERILVKAGSSANPSTALDHGANGAITLSGERYYTLETTGPKPLSQTASEFAAYVGEAFEVALPGTVSGGTGSYSFSLKTPASLPAWLSQTGNTLSGTPTSTSDSCELTFTVQDTEETSLSDDFTYTITVTRKPKKITYYNGAVEILGLTPTNYVEGTVTALAASAPAATGYEFAGWYGNSELTGDPVNSLTAEATGNQEFWAKFTPIVYTVTYMDGSTPITDQNLTPTNFTIESAALPLPATATKAGYGFYGWYDNSACSGSQVTTIPAGSTEDKTFYAKWGAIKVNTSYVDASGTAMPEQLCAVVTSGTTSLETGWYVVNGNVSIGASVTVSGDVNLILADGSHLEVTVPSGYSSGLNVASGNSLTIYAQSGGTGRLDATGASSISSGIGGNSGQACGYVTINGGTIVATGGTGIGGGYQQAGGTVTINGGVVTATGTGAAGIGGGNDGAGGSLTVNGGTVTATGCYTAGVGGGSSGANHGTLTVASKVTVKAGSSANPTTVLNPNGETDLTSLLTGQWYFTFETVGPTPLSQTASEFAAYIDEAFELALPGTVSGGTGSYSFTLKTPASLPAWLSRSGDTLSGTPTSTSDSCVLTFTVQDTEETSLSRDFTYTITVTPKPKKITYYNGAVEILGLTPTNYVEGTVTALAPSAPAATGYELAGWYGNSELTGDPVSSLTAEATGNQEFWAKFTPIVYTVTYMDGSTPITDQNLTPTNFTIESAALPLPATATKSGYGFYGWYDNSACSGSQVTTIPAGSTENKTFYAKWGAVKVNTPYVDASGNAMPEELCAVVTSETTSLESGWYVVNGEVTINSPVTVSGDVKLILADGSRLVVTATGNSDAAINVSGENSLTIYSQTLGTGALEATGGSISAGIGGGYFSPTCGTITINGGTITATAPSGGAGIGGGYSSSSYGSGSGGTITINGGTVTANGAYAGIGGGGGNPAGAGGTVVVNGGTVTATGNGCPGVGGGSSSVDQGTLTVGAKITVKAGSSANPDTVLNPNGETVLTSLLTGQSYFIFETVGPTPLRQTTSEITAYVGEAFELALSNTVSGGTAPYSFTSVSGTLPDGLVFNAGVIAGTPTAATPAGDVVYAVADSGIGSDAQDTNFTYTITVTRKPKKITYYDGAEEILGLTPTNYMEGTGATLAASASKPGYDFVGWFGNSELTGDPVTTISSEATGNQEVWASWTLHNYTITYYDDVTPLSTLVPATYTILDNVNLPQNPPKSGDYTFDGWYTSSSFTGSPVATITAGSTGNKEFWGKWIAPKLPTAYVDASGNAMPQQNCDEITSGTTALETGWYVVRGTVNIGSPVIISGDVNLILSDGATLTVDAKTSSFAGIALTSGNTLTIWGQANSTGTLNAKSWSAGIGSASDSVSCGTLNVYGGNVYANGGFNSAGIGGHSTSLASGTLKVGVSSIVKAGDSSLVSQNVRKIPAADGTITLEGEAYYEITTSLPVSVSYRDTDGTDKPAACRLVSTNLNSLSTGWYAVTNDVNLGNLGLEVSGNVNLIIADSASLVVTGASYKAGISVPVGSTLTIYGQTLGTGTITAMGGGQGAGIGGNKGSESDHTVGACGTVVINGGVITAKGGTSAAGIGGGSYGNGGTVRVNGGTVTATGSSQFAAGIGGGDNECTDMGTLTVSASCLVKSGTSVGNMTELPSDSETGVVELDGKQYYTITPKSTSHIYYMDGVTSLTSLVPATYVEGVGTDLASTAAKDGCVFVGWHYESDLSDPVVTQIPASATGDKTVYAEWIAAAAVAYVDASGVAQSPVSAWPLTATLVSKAGTTLDKSWYYVDGNVDLGTTDLKVQGNVGIILNDGALLSVTGDFYKAGIEVTSGNSLTIYARTSLGTGAIYAEGGGWAAGIGGSKNGAGGTVTVNGGNVTAVGKDDSAGIGGGSGGIGGNVTVNGGRVVATSGSNGTRGIGGSSGAGMDVDNGTLKAAAWMVVNAGAGADPSETYYADSETGIVTVTGTPRYFVIAVNAGYRTITYKHGDVVLIGLEPTWYTAGVGTNLPTSVVRPGYRFDGWYANSELTGDPVTAISSSDDDPNPKTFWGKFTPVATSIDYIDENGERQSANCDPLTADTDTLGTGWYYVSGTLESRTAGITVSGAAKLVLVDDAEFTVTGGVVNAGITVTGSGNSLTIYGQTKSSGKLTATGGLFGAGIGGGQNENGGTVRIYGGEVLANGWSGGIGAGDGASDPGSLTVGSYVSVSAGSSLGLLSPKTPDANGVITLGGERYYVVTTDRPQLINYLDANGAGQSHLCKILTTETTSLTDGWYAVEGSLAFDSGISVTGTDVHLILEDGVTLTAAGVLVPEGKALTIYAQSTGASMGALNATGGEWAAGIGGAHGNGGNVTINGGSITATGGDYAAGIGGGFDGNGGNVTINGGSITATGGTYAAGIGGGNDGNGGTVTINGGTVTATSGYEYAAGIGGSSSHANGTLTVSPRMIVKAGAGANPETTLTIAQDGTVTNTGKLRYFVVGPNANYYTITYKNGDDTLTNLAPSWYTAGAGTVQLPANVELDGYTFEGWYANSELTGDPVTEISSSDPGANKTFWGRFALSAMNVTFIGADGNPDTRLCTRLTTGKTELTNGWYYAEGTLDYGTGGITVLGDDVNIVLKDGANVSVTGGQYAVGVNKAGITVTNGNALAIYAQSTGAGAGSITATGGSSAPGIGGYGAQLSTYRELSNAGTVSIYGGNITAIGGSGGAGIGGGEYGAGGNVTIWGANVTATGGTGGTYGIGRGVDNISETKPSNGTLTTSWRMFVRAGVSSPTTLFPCDIETGLVKVESDIPLTYFTVTVNEQAALHTITYRHLGADVLGLTPTNYIAGVGAVLATNVTLAGYEFEGWYANSDFSGSAVTDISASDSGDKTYYAKSHRCGTVSEQYLDANGVLQDARPCTVIESDFSVLDTSANSGWYVVYDSLALEGEGLTVDGDVKIILKNNSSLMATGAVSHAAIAVPAGSSLTIYAQSTGSEAGTLTAIGGNWGAGIGGCYGAAASGAITVNGGTVTATGGVFSAGIGGYDTGSVGAITINAGTVIATGGDDSAGIGGGHDGAGGTVTINGGTVTATGATSSAGIGGGNGGAGGMVTINGGTVNAMGESGIGGGMSANGGTVAINGGEVTATGISGAGIGGGYGAASQGTLRVGSGVSVYAKTALTDFAQKVPNASGYVTLNGEKYYKTEIVLPVNVEYYLADGETRQTQDCTILTAGMSVLPAGWYAVTNDLAVNGSFVVDGAVNIILADDVTLTVGSGAYEAAGIAVTNLSASLTIWGQQKGNGELCATGGVNAAGIGGGSGECRAITVNGGVINATGGMFAAGIGGGNGGAGGAITLNRGTINATAGDDGAGVGGGRNGAGGTVTINGGTVTATGGSSGAGIGGGSQGAGGTVTITNATVTAIGGTSAAGIGGGSNGSGGTVTINGGTVTATSGNAYVTGIGKGYYGSANGTLTVGGCMIVRAGAADNAMTKLDVNRATGVVDAGDDVCRYFSIYEISASEESTITYMSEGDPLELSPSTFTYGAGLVSLPNPATRIGWTFLGWYDNDAFDGSAVTSIPAGVMEDVTLYARWTRTVESVQFIGASGAPQQENCTVLIPEENVLPTGWYVVDGDVNFGEDGIAMEANANVKIVLKDNASLVVTGALGKAGISVPAGSKLEIYSQSLGGDMGSLEAVGRTYAAGIGGDNEGDFGIVEIYGGVVTAKGGYRGAGIGGGSEGSVAGGTVMITNGVVTAIGAMDAAGIGGGYGGDGFTVTIYGGDVQATGGSNGAGIGGGNEGNGSTVAIYGGIVEATGTGGGAGIGGGQRGDAGTFRIYGGDVEATGGSNAAGIGGGNGFGVGGAGGTVVVEGGYVVAQGGTGAAGIGGGSGATGGSVTINDGVVVAFGGTAGSGVGGGVDALSNGTLFVAPSLIAKSGEAADAMSAMQRDSAGNATLNGDQYFKGGQAETFTITYKDGDNVLNLAPASYDEGVGASLPTPSPAPVGCMFGGWRTVPEGSIIGMITDTDFGDKVLQAVWLEVTPTDALYIDANGTAQTAVDCIPLTEDMSQLVTGCYIATGDLSFDGMRVSGNVELILADGARLATTGGLHKAGIAVASGSTLTIYGQRCGTGKLYATSIGGGAGIGGDKGISGGTVYIYGGLVTAEGGYCAGIGGGRDAADNGLLYVGSGLDVLACYVGTELLPLPRNAATGEVALSDGFRRFRIGRPEAVAGLAVLERNLSGAEAGSVSWNLADTIANGVRPYRFALRDGSTLPTGLELSESGILSGYMGLGATSFSVLVTDSSLPERSTIVNYNFVYLGGDVITVNKEWIGRDILPGYYWSYDILDAITLPNELMSCTFTLAPSGEGPVPGLTLDGTKICGIPTAPDYYAECSIIATYSPDNNPLHLTSQKMVFKMNTMHDESLDGSLGEGILSKTVGGVSWNHWKILKPGEKTRHTAVLYNEDLSVIPNGTSGAVTIPSTFTDSGEVYPVTCIGVLAFNNCFNLTSVVIPDTVQAIGSLAFGGCSSLESLTIPSSVSQIDKSAFYGIGSGFATIYVGAGDAERVKALFYASVADGNDDYDFDPASVAFIEVADLNPMHTVTLSADGGTCSPASVSVREGHPVGELPDPYRIGYRFLGWYTASGGSGSKVDEYSTIVYNDVTYYAHWEELTVDPAAQAEVFVRATLEGVAVGLYNPYSSITEITLGYKDGKVEKYGGEIEEVACWGIEGDEEGGILKDKPQVQRVTIGGTVTTIGDSAFANSAGLREVVIDGANVRYIRANAFKGCTNLKRVTVSSSVESIGAGAFEGCTSLESVEFTGAAQNLKTITRSAFKGCSSLRTFTVPQGVENLGRIFQDCDALETVTIGSGVTNIAEMAFASCRGLKSITIPNNVRTMGKYVFEDCTALGNVQIGSGITKIEEYLFKNCTSLTNVTLGSGVEEIGTRAFHNCTALAEVAFPANLRTIDSWAFADCYGLTEVDFSSAAGDVEIGNWAFQNCSALKSLTFPSARRVDVGKGAFSYCISLEDFYLPKGSIGDFAIFCCASLKNASVNGTPLGTKKKGTKGVKLMSMAKGRSLLGAGEPEDDSVSVGKAAFSGCPTLDYVELGSDVDDVAGGAFSGCPKLTSFTIDSGNGNVKSVGGLLLTKDGRTLISASGSETSVTVPDGVTNVLEGAFSDYSGLKSVTLPGSMKVIDAGAFSNATDLAMMAIPSNVVFIGANAFYGTKLATVHVNAGDTSRMSGLVTGSGYAASVNYVEDLPAPSPSEPIDWPADTSEVAAQTAAEAYGITEGPLTNANAKALADWAKNPEKGNVNYAEMDSIIPDAFLLDCANNAAAVAAAAEEAKEDIKIVSITFDEFGEPILTILDEKGDPVVVNDATSTYKNGRVVLQGSASIGASASWHDGKQDGDRFFRTVLVP